jgi:uncharacterized protein
VTETRVLVTSGHMVDTPDRPRPRFPPDQVARVTAEVRAALDGWAIGPQTTLVTGGARGADIIAAEECLERGARVVLRLALPPTEFEQSSVALPDGDWVPRFRAVLERSEWQVLEDGPRDESVFERTNEWIVETARAIDDTPRALIVWNGQEGDGPGGTRHFVRLLGYQQPEPGIHVIDPTRRAYEAKQSVGDGPKKLLALDGGGIRGALSLEILRTLEARLRSHYNKDQLVLADYFDYIAGTSTGAIIAAALALGKRVDELQALYRDLGKKIFSRRFFPLRFRSMYRDGPLGAELEAFFGEGRTLGDPGLETLLLVVLHNTATDSPWPLSNCTRAKYNRADRYLKTPPDRNLDLPLATLVRGSTAAPIYFPPQEIQVGTNRFVYEDGGVTPFNNPALIMFLMATLPEYGLRWPVGEDQLLIVSVGTGSSPAVHPNVLAKEVNVAFNAKNLPSVFMNGASTSQDLLCRSLGRCLAGPEIDREFGSRIDELGVAGTNLFTYVRYNADLSDDSLSAQGFTDERRRRGLRKLDAVGHISDLEALGHAVGESIDFNRDFADFL